MNGDQLAVVVVGDIGDEVREIRADIYRQHFAFDTVAAFGIVYFQYAVAGPIISIECGGICFDHDQYFPLPDPKLIALQDIPGHLAEDIINKRSSTTKWKKYLDKKDEQYIRELFASSDLEFNKMTPAELFAFLGRRYNENICIGKDPAASYFSLDDYIGSIAEQNQITVKGLETSEEQVRLINEDIRGMPAKVHKKRLSRMIARIQSGSRDNCAETEWYSDMQFDFKMDQPCTNTLMLTDRNNKWMIQIKENLKTNNCFIVVGLSHLMFNCGLLNQLRDLGYTIEPVYVN